MKSFTRALARLVAAVGAALMAITLLVANPLTRPTLLGEAVVMTEAHLDAVVLGTDLLLRQALTEEGSPDEDQKRPFLNPAEQKRFRSVLADAFTADWLIVTVRDVAEDAEVWIAGMGSPPVTIDLGEPKERIRDHPDSMLLVRVLAEPDVSAEIGPAGGDAEAASAAVDEFLAELPDRAELHETGWWEDVITRTGDMRQGTVQIGLTAGAIALLAAAGGLALSRPPKLPAATGWVGWLTLWVALPVLALVWAIPAMAAAIPLPGELSMLVRIVQGTWDSTRVIGWVGLGMSLTLWALTHVLREGASVRQHEPEPTGDARQVPVTAS